MSFVLDTSITAVWAFDDEDHPIATLAQEVLLEGQAFTPSLWWYELRNTLVMNERRKRISETQANSFLQVLAKLPIRLDFEPVESDVISLARRHKLTVYDASYLELALRLGLPLATLDSEIIAAARAENVKLIEAT